MNRITITNKKGKETRRKYRISLIIMTALFSFFLGCGNKPAGGNHERMKGPGYSGMALLKDNRFVVVYDTKYKKNKKNRAPRVGLVTVEPVANGDILVDETGINMKWGKHRRPANDLEAICKVEGKENEFLLAESGDKLRYGVKGFIYHVKLKTGKKGKWKGAVLNRIKMPDSLCEVEGIGCIDLNQNGNANKYPGKYLVILGQRGGKNGGNCGWSDKNNPARIYWGILELKNGSGDLEFELSGHVTFTAVELGLNSPGDVRSCSDLYVDNDRRLWISAAVDCGDRGPFRSVIYLAGKILPGNTSAPIQLLDKPIVYWKDNRVKVEAIGPPPTFAGTLDALNKKAPGLMSIGTDDEDLGSAWKLVVLSRL